MLGPGSYALKPVPMRITSILSLKEVSFHVVFPPAFKSRKVFLILGLISIDNSWNESYNSTLGDNCGSHRAFLKGLKKSKVCGIQMNELCSCAVVLCHVKECRSVLGRSFLPLFVISQITNTVDVDAISREKL